MFAKLSVHLGLGYPTLEGTRGSDVHFDELSEKSSSIKTYHLKEGVISLSHEQGLLHSVAWPQFSLKPTIASHPTCCYSTRERERWPKKEGLTGTDRSVLPSFASGGPTDGKSDERTFFS